MSLKALRRQGYWLLPLVAAVLVALLGTRLVMLSVHERAGQLRRTAESAVLRHARSIETELAALAGATAAGHAESDRGAHSSAAASPPGTSSPDRGMFSMSAEGAVLSAARSDAAIASAVAAEWTAAPAARRSALLFGPLRYGSRWIVVARTATDAHTLSVSYENLESLLARARFGTLVREGYDFQLSQPDPQTHQPRLFLSSYPGKLTEPATSTIGLPGTPTRANATPYLTLAIRPHSGWYPARELAAELGLLALLVWAVSFAAYDVTHSLERTRSALAATRRRLHLLNERLVGEIEQRESLQRSFEHARYHDGFTGLPNRRYFMDQLDRALREIRTRRRRRILIALIDIERLRLISDTLGHTAGDELLLQAAQRCAQLLGATEHVLSRWGGDQLAVLLYEVASTAGCSAPRTRCARRTSRYPLRGSSSVHARWPMPPAWPAPP